MKDEWMKTLKQRGWRVIIVQCATFALVVGLCGCAKKWSPQDEHFVRVYVDVLVLREQFPDTTEANPKVREFLQRQGFTEPLFAERYAAYAANPDEFRQMIDSARVRTRAVAEAERARSQKTPASQPLR